MMAVRAAKDHMLFQCHMRAHKRALCWELEDMEKKVEGLNGETRKRARKVLAELKGCLDQLEDERGYVK